MGLADVKNDSITTLIVERLSDISVMLKKTSLSFDDEKTDNLSMRSIRDSLGKALDHQEDSDELMVKISEAVKRNNEKIETSHSELERISYRIAGQLLSDMAQVKNDLTKIHNDYALQNETDHLKISNRITQSNQQNIDIVERISEESSEKITNYFNGKVESLSKRFIESIARLSRTVDKIEDDSFKRDKQTKQSIKNIAQYVRETISKNESGLDIKIKALSKQIDKANDKKNITIFGGSASTSGTSSVATQHLFTVASLPNGCTDIENNHGVVGISAAKMYLVSVYCDNSSVISSGYISNGELITSIKNESGQDITNLNLIIKMKEV
jgi:hypothetical protein